MATKISVQKGSAVTLNVIVSYAVAALSVWASRKFGVPLDEAMQTQLIVAGTALLAGAIHGIINWWKHRKIPTITTSTTTPAPTV